MGVLPLQFIGERHVQSLGIKGDETFDVKASTASSSRNRKRRWSIHRGDGRRRSVKLMLRIDTPIEVDYYKHGGILPFVLRQLLAA